MKILTSLIFILIFIAAITFFITNLKKLYRNIMLGRKVRLTDDSSARWKLMLRVALGQGKMTKKPIAGILHIVVYVGFMVINLELVEIILDGILGTHRLFLPVFGTTLYGFLIACFEGLAILVLLGVSVFWIRRNIIKVARFWKPEMKGFPKRDADNILYIEMVLMSLFLLMNATDTSFQQLGVGNIVSQHLSLLFETLDAQTLHYIERSAWWMHIVGILMFLNYLYYSKHLHIILAFPNTYFSSLNPLGSLDNLPAVTREVQLMMNPQAVSDTETSDAVTETFGARDVIDLSRQQLLSAYTCTECGRCTAACPANATGKELSPRKIMMNTRDRLEELGKWIDKKGIGESDGKYLLSEEYISTDEIWACTSCMACVEACPVLINPLSIIVDLRRYLVMEQSAAPQELNAMMTNIENNGAPWQFNQADRLKWREA